MNMFKRVALSALLLLTGAVAFAAPAQSGAPLTVGGSFSSKVTNNQTVVFDQQTREAEIAALNARLKNKDFAGTVRRINELTARNFLDQRFYLLLAIAYDGLHQYEDVIYSAGEASYIGQHLSAGSRTTYSIRETPGNPNR